MDEQYKDCPSHTNIYEADGVKHTVVSHFAGDNDINDVMLNYAYIGTNIGLYFNLSSTQIVLVILCIGCRFAALTIICQCNS